MSEFGEGTPEKKVTRRSVLKYGAAAAIGSVLGVLGKDSKVNVLKDSNPKQEKVLSPETESTTKKLYYPGEIKIIKKATYPGEAAPTPLNLRNEPRVTPNGEPSNAVSIDKIKQISGVDINKNEFMIKNPVLIQDDDTRHKGNPIDSYWIEVQAKVDEEMALDKTRTLYISLGATGANIPNVPEVENLQEISVAEENITRGYVETNNEYQTIKLNEIVFPQQAQQ